MDQRYLWDRSYPDWDANGSNAARYIHRRRTFPVQPEHIGRVEARNIDMLMQNLNIHLAAVRVTGNGEIVSLRGRHRENVRIVRKEQIYSARLNH